MIDFTLKDPLMLLLLPLVGFFVGFHLLQVIKRNKDVTNFAGASHTNEQSQNKLSYLKLALQLIGIILVIVALARPAWNRHPQNLNREERDLVFVLDVSRSMLGEDLRPNRLERAKVAIRECVGSLKNQRIGLVIFAGSASIKCPLTLDYDFFLQSLDKAAPDSVSQGGTRIEDALLKTSDKLFSLNMQGYRDIILISDGGDQGKKLEKAIEELNNKQIKLIAIGLGDEGRGARIPVGDYGDSFVLHDGKEVWTKLDSSQLRKMTKMAKRGAYIPAGIKNMQLSRIYQQLCDGEELTLKSEHTVMVYDEKFRLFLGAALVLLLLRIFIPNTLCKPSKLVLCLLFFSLISTAKADDGAKAEAAFEVKEYVKAIEFYRKALEVKPTPELHYNLGNALFRNHSFMSAIENYYKTLEFSSISADLRCKVTYNMANAYNKQSLINTTPYLAVEDLEKAISLYRKVLRQQPDFKDAAINMELTRVARKKKREEIEQSEKEQKEMQEMLKKIRKKLFDLVKEQTINLSSTNDLIKQKKERPDTQPLVQRETFIVTETRLVKKMVDGLGNKYFMEVEEKMNPFKTAGKLLAQAEPEQLSATEKLKSALAEAPAYEVKSLKLLKQALESIPDDPNSQKNQSGESDKGEEGDEEAEEDPEGEEGDASSDSLKDSPDSQDIPPPNETPEDILKQAEENQKQRVPGKGKKGKKVKMDW